MAGLRNRRVEEDGLQGGFARPLGKARDLNVAKAVVGKAGMPRLDTATVEDIRVGLKTLAGVEPENVLGDGCLVEFPIVGQTFGVPHLDRRPGWSAHAKLSMAGEVLAKVEHIHSGL